MESDQTSQPETARFPPTFTPERLATLFAPGIPYGPIEEHFTRYPDGILQPTGLESTAACLDSRRLSGTRNWATELRVEAIKDHPLLMQFAGVSHGLSRIYRLKVGDIVLMRTVGEDYPLAVCYVAELPEEPVYYVGSTRSLLLRKLPESQANPQIAAHSLARRGMRWHYRNLVRGSVATTLLTSDLMRLPIPLLEPTKARQLEGLTTNLFSLAENRQRQAELIDKLTEGVIHYAIALDDLKEAARHTSGAFEQTRLHKEQPAEGVWTVIGYYWNDQRYCRTFKARTPEAAAGEAWRLDNDDAGLRIVAVIAGEHAGADIGPNVLDRATDLERIHTQPEPREDRDL